MNSKNIKEDVSYIDSISVENNDSFDVTIKIDKDVRDDYSYLPSKLSYIKLFGNKRSSEYMIMFNALREHTDLSKPNIETILNKEQNVEVCSDYIEFTFTL